MTRELPNILMVTAHFAPAIGGTERQAQALAAGLVDLGHTVTVLTLARSGLPVREVMDGIVVERRLSGRGRGIVFACTYLASVVFYIRKLRRANTVLHAHHLYLEAMGTVCAGRSRGLPTIAKVAGGGPYGDFERLRRTHLVAALPLLRQLKRVVAVSRETEVDLLAHGFRSERVVRIPNGVDVTRFAPPADAEAPRQDLGAGPEPILYLGRLEEGKGVDTALAAWAQVSARRPAARLVLAGDGPLRPGLEAMASRLGIADRVEFRGFRNDPEALLCGAMAFLFPSFSEGLSNALLEAMATGLPCVATRVGGNVDVVEHGENGLLVRPGEPEDLAEALLGLLDNAELRRRLGKRARETVVQEFALGRVVQRYHELYGTLIRSADEASRADACRPGLRSGDR